MSNNQNELNTALDIVKILNEKNARNIRVLHVTDKTVIADYFVICTGMSNTQVKALAGEIEYKMGEKGLHPHHTEGYNEASWVLLDYSSVIVHVFYKDTRDFYGLEKLWSDAEEVDISSLITEK